jgi:cytochrome d ubiquinol oxidase subunit I
MDPLLLARIQFGTTTIYHFFFVPLTLGLSILVAVLETLYVRTGQQVYKDMTKFWGKLFLINFAMGVVTGIVQEFQFGMNWSEYSRYVGDIFGAPLAIEALSAFFLESTFLGIWIFGWEKLSKKAHAAVIWLVAIGSNLSAIWILIANSFMQHPVGYTENLETGRLEMTNFLALITNPTAMFAILHTLLSGLATASFFILGISAYHLLRKNGVEAFKRSARIAAVVGTFAAVLVGLAGHTLGQEIYKNQPMKMAAAEGLWETTTNAPFTVVEFGNLDVPGERFKIQIPGMVSLLAYNSFSAEVAGIDELQKQYEQDSGAGDYVPPVTLAFWTFRIMVGVGTLMALLGLLAWIFLSRKSSKFSHLLLLILPFAIALPYLANSCGWLLTETGRYPWVVYGLLLMKNGVSTVVPGYQVLISLIVYVLVYASLMVADVFLLVKFARRGIEHEDDTEPKEESTPSLVGY